MSAVPPRLPVATARIVSHWASQSAGQLEQTRVHMPLRNRVGQLAVETARGFE